MTPPEVVSYAMSETAFIVHCDKRGDISIHTALPGPVLAAQLRSVADDVGRMPYVPAVEMTPDGTLAFEADRFGGPWEAMPGKPRGGTRE